MKMKNFKAIITFLLLASSPSLHAGEKAYLHLDNSAYFLGDTLRLSAYVMDTDTKRLTNKSKVLYVELLAPEGYIVETHTYPLENGKCVGDFYLRPLLLSGLFEIRAYTRYMQNEGVGNYYSHVIPIYESVKNGDYSALTMRKREVRNKNKKRSRYAKVPKCLDWESKGDAKTVSSDAPISLVASYDKDCLQPFQLVTVKLKGMPHACVSLSVVDKKSYITRPSGSLVDWMNGSSPMKFSVKTNCAYQPEEGITIYGKAFKKRKSHGMGNVPISANLFLPSGVVSKEINTEVDGKLTCCLGDFQQDAHVLLRYADESESLDHKKISITYPNEPVNRKYTQEELSLQKQVVMGGADVHVRLLTSSQNLNFQYENSSLRFDLLKVVDKMIETGICEPSINAGGAYGLLLMDMLVDDNYGINWSSMRTIFLPGEYPGDSVVPQCTSIKNYGFNLFKSKELVFRTDDAICTEYGFYNHLAMEDRILPAPANQVGLPGRNKNDFAYVQDNSKPSLVCCVVPDMEHEWDKYLEYNQIPGFRYMKVSGYTPILPYRLPNYSVSHPKSDFRRLLYWNPNLQLDENGEATIQFFNNGSCHDILISGEGVTDDGRALVVCE